MAALDTPQQQAGDSGVTVFGFLPADTLHRIQELGNWKTRSWAIEHVQHGLAALTPQQQAQLLRELPQFVDFVLQLLHDHNFKVVAAGLSTLAVAASYLRAALQPHITVLAPIVHEKLLDGRAPVCEAASKACMALTQHALAQDSTGRGSSSSGGVDDGAAALVNQLLQLQEQRRAEACSSTAAAQDASALLDVLLWVQLCGAPAALDTVAAAQLLLSCIQGQPPNAISRQAGTAMECLALLADTLGPQLPALLKQAGATDLAVTQLLTQCRQLQRPSLAADGGAIQHNETVQAAIAAAEAAAAGRAGASSAGGNATSFRITSAGGASGRAGVSSPGAVADKLGLGGSRSSSKLHASDGGGSMWQQHHQHQQQLPPGSLGALAAHAQLLSSTASSIAQAAAATAALAASSSSSSSNQGGLGLRPESGLALLGNSGSTSSIAAAADAASHFAQHGGEQHQQQLQSDLDSVQAQLLCLYARVESGAGRTQASAAGAQHTGSCDGSELGRGGAKLAAAAIAAEGGAVNMRYQFPLQHSAHLAAQQGAAGSSSSWSAAPGAWSLPEQLAADAASMPLCSGRVEALSPSRGERLAQLKRRQVEKRASSAIGASRASNPWDSQDSTASGAAGSMFSSPSASVTLPGGDVSAAGQQQQQQQQQQHRASTAGSPSPVSHLGSWRLSGAAAAADADADAGSQSPLPAQATRGPLLNWHIPTGPDGRVLAATAAAGGPASGSGSSSPVCASSAGQRGISISSRFQHQQQGGGSASPPPLGSMAGGAASTLASSRLHSSAGSSGLWSFRQQQQQQTQGLRVQTAEPAGAAGSLAAAVGGAAWPDGGGGCSSPSSRLSSANGRGGSCNSSTAAGGASSPSGSRPGLSSSSSGRGGSSLRGVLGGGERPSSVGIAAGDTELDGGAELYALPDPETALRQAVSKLQQANTAARKEMDWQAQLEALLDARRLAAHHAEVLRPAARELIQAALPAVEELRSTTARMAIMLFQELPAAVGSFDRELDDVVPVLLKKAGDLSTAGRDNFLAQEADRALSGVCAAASEARALSALIAAGAKHKSPHVRCRAAAHLDELAAGGAGLEALLRSGNWPMLDRLFKTAAALLQEGSLDTRTYSKRLLWAVKAVLRGNRADLDRLLSGVAPEAVQRRVVEVLEGLSGPPPPPASRGSTSAGPRVAPRGASSSGCSTPNGASLPAGAGSSCQPPYSAPPPGYSGSGSMGSPSNSGAARRALFLQAGGGAAGGREARAPGAPHVRGAGSAAAAAAAAGNSSASGSCSPADSSRRRRSSVAAAADGLGQAPHTAAAAAVPPGPPGPMSPELQEAVEQVGLHLGSKDWRNRMDALRALMALLPALPEVPNGPLEGLLGCLVGRLADGNAKVNQKALEVLCDVAAVLGGRCLLALPALLPALTANLGSTHERLRGCAAAALDAVAAATAAQPQQLLLGLAQAVAGSSSARSRIAAAAKLQAMLPQVHQQQPQLTRLVLPAAFALALEARGELKPAAAQLVASLAGLLGSGALLAAAAGVSAPIEQRVRELLLGLGGRSSG